MVKGKFMFTAIDHALPPHPTLSPIATMLRSLFKRTVQKLPAMGERGLSSDNEAVEHCSEVTAIASRQTSHLVTFDGNTQTLS